MATAVVDASFPVGTNMDLFDIGLLATGTISSQTASQYFVDVGQERLVFTGTGFSSGSSVVTSGTVTGLQDQYQGAPNFTISGFAIAATSFVTWAGAHDNVAAKTAIFAGADVVTGGDFNDLLRSYGGADTLSGGAGADTLDAGDGDDVINGGAGRDVITTGGGADTVIVGLGHSGLEAATADVIVDWTSADKLIFAHVPASASEYAENSAPSFAVAATYASGLILTHAATLVAVAVGDVTGDGFADIAVFSDSANNGGAFDDAVILSAQGRSLGLDDVSYTNFTTAPVTPAPPPPPPSPPPPPPPAPPAPPPTTPISPAAPGSSTGGTAGADSFTASPGGGAFDGADGNDTLAGAAGNDTLQGGGGDDVLRGGDGANYMRGGDGQDQIVGGSGFDDINGNAGNDTASGGLGDDWVVGGKDNDSLSGDAGSDVVWGNLGNDTCAGGDGADQVRGGQGDDSISGGGGNDFLSGDRGNDTISGGAGADIFHGSQDAGVDRVLDFNLADGDRVMLDPGTTYTLAQVGSDTVIDMGAGNEMILVGVQLSTLNQGWIF